MKKTANLPMLRDNFQKALVGGMGAAAATATLGAGSMAAQKIWDAATKARDFRQMMAHNADLHEHHQRDPRTFNQLYTSLRTMNPTFAKDPIVAGTYMRQMVETPLNAGGILAQTIGTRDKFPSVLGRAADEGIGASRSYFSRQNPKGAPQGDPGDAPPG